jgi:molybdate transport system substrate-binding protein
MLRRSRANTVGLLISVTLAAHAFGSEIRVISTGNIRPALDDLQKDFESNGTDKVVITTQGAAATQRLVENGAVGEVVVAARPMLDSLAAQGKVRPGSIVDIAHSSVGVVARLGASMPDISSDDKFKSLLLSADSIVYPDPEKGSLGGNVFATVIRDWGIESQLKSKSLLVGGGVPTGHAVAEGKAHFGINQIAELRPVSGLAYLLPLPPALTDKIVMSAGVLSTVKEERGAAAWIAYISGPAAASAIKAHGMDPKSN